ncbi:N-acetyltransferase family protein [Pseudactinotalea sp. Z1748]|uniref:GNAT family N-acetyltransferase n=1 Tax=Pseudactinotalea sp. Z1748 TaxID=3413027 RepID=UPI003C7E6020
MPRFVITHARLPTDDAEGAHTGVETGAGGTWARAEPSWQIRGIAELDRDYLVEALGSDDLAEDAEQMAVRLANQRDTRKEVLLALDPDHGQDPAAVLGAAWLEFPATDNTHLARVSVIVRSTHRRRGIGSALWNRALRGIRGAGRAVVTAETCQRTEPEADSPDALAAPTGSGRVDAREPGVRFLRARGCTLAQVDRHSVQHLPLPDGLLAGLGGAAATRAGEDYELLSWTDAVPQRWLAGMAVLLRAMSTDAPTGALDYQEENWDSDRIRHGEQVLAASGMRSITTAARHARTGELAGYTEIHLDARKPQVAYQENTVVLTPHRGHRLGMLLKTTNLDLLAREAPLVRRVHTWNAQENEHMLAINVALGYHVASIWGAWQLGIS